MSKAPHPINCTTAPKVAVIGLGYVGLPLAVAFDAHYPTYGFDIDGDRIAELQDGKDSSDSVEPAELAAASLTFTAAASDIAAANVYIIAVPTPVDIHKTADLTILKAASKLVGQVMAAGDLVIYESTVYPGATEEDCLPVLEQVSGLRLHEDFHLGYSPERINPGDTERKLADIIKVTSGSTPAVADAVDALYRQVITAGTHKATSIRVAEAAKVIENVQRDLNIALINELALIFDKMGVDTTEVLEAAGTKWNFLPFRPGLVGGHCIGVDPYYLTTKAREIGYHPDVILAGRRINDGMGGYVADKVAKLLVREGVALKGARVLVLGASFKENCPDLRNTKVLDIVKQLQSWGISPSLCDPWVDIEALRQQVDCTVSAELPTDRYDGVILAVAHQQYAALSRAELDALLKPDAVVYDVKSLWPKSWITARL